MWVISRQFRLLDGIVYDSHKGPIELPKISNYTSFVSRHWVADPILNQGKRFKHADKYTSKGLKKQ
jgi:hypothetical protein